MGQFQSIPAHPKHAITHAHKASAHGGFLSGAFQGCLSGLSKSSPASPFLCRHHPADRQYFPECPHCTTGYTAHNSASSWKFQGTGEWRMWGAPQVRSSGAVVLEHLSCVVYDMDSQSSFSPQPCCYFFREAFSDYHHGPQSEEFSSTMAGLRVCVQGAWAQKAPLEIPRALDLILRSMEFT